MNMVCKYIEHTMLKYTTEVHKMRNIILTVTNKQIYVKIDKARKR